MNMNDEDWKKKLTPEQYRVLREKGTEVPYSGQYFTHSEDGMYACAACGAELFTSNDKYDTHVPGLDGWPSFAAAAASDSIILQPDMSHGMERTEVVCKNCGSHLGHLFPDTTSPTSEHFCINSVALDFKKKQ